MTAAPAPPWPASRTLLDWWRKLAARRPRRLAVARLLMHRVEALVRVRRSLPLDPWQQALLRLAGTRLPCRELPAALADLRLDPQLLSGLLGELTAAGLLYRNGTDLWDLTASGRLAVQAGARAVADEQRRTFYFVDNAGRGRPPSFFASRRPPPLAALPPAEAAGHPFDLASLEECLRQPPDWKARHHFPADAEALLPPRPDAAPEENTPRVVLDAPGHLSLALVHAAGPDGDVLLAFAVRPEGGELEAEPLPPPAEGWEGVLPEWNDEPPPEAWRRAWQAWAQPRGLPAADVEACRLERTDHRLRVQAPPRLIDRLRAARSDAVKQEAWVLAGEGRVRFAVQIELHPL